VRRLDPPCGSRLRYTLEKVERFRRPGFAVLWLSLALGAAYRLWVAFTDDGIFWPDEIYQSLEPAHRLVFGYGLVPWEFIDGARNWALPGFVAFLMKLAVAFGASEPRGYLGMVRVTFVAISMGSAYGAYRLARSYGATELAAAAGASTFALGALPLYFGHRAMSETASMLPVTFGLWLTLRPDATRKWLVWGGSLLGLAVLLRLQCGIFAAGVLAVLAARRQWRASLTVLGALAVWALLYGLLDRVTWGDWFHSAQRYIQFNLIEGKAAGWGTHPWHHLLTHLFTSMMGVSFAFAIGLLVGHRVLRAALDDRAQGDPFHHAGAAAVRGVRRHRGVAARALGVGRGGVRPGVDGHGEVAHVRRPGRVPRARRSDRMGRLRQREPAAARGAPSRGPVRHSHRRRAPRVDRRRDVPAPQRAAVPPGQSASAVTAVQLRHHRPGQRRAGGGEGRRARAGAPSRRAVRSQPRLLVATPVAGSPASADAT
jgi:hypothetical protein